MAYQPKPSSFKYMKSVAMLHLMETNPMSRSHMISGEFSILYVCMVCFRHHQGKMAYSAVAFEYTDCISVEV